MDDVSSEKRIAVELERLGQEVRVLQHLLEDSDRAGTGEVVALLRHLSTRAARLADMVERLPTDVGA